MSGKHQSFFKEAGINKCHKNVLYVSVNIFSFFFFLSSLCCHSYFAGLNVSFGRPGLGGLS